MKRILFIVTLGTLLGTLTSSLVANPTNTIPFKVVQPNGDSITIIQYGDEYGSWYETLDGYVIDKNSSNYWVYVKTDSINNLVTTNQIVNDSHIPYGINLDNIFTAIDNRRQITYNMMNADTLLAPNLEDEETALGVQQGETLNIAQAKAPAKNKGTINILTILIQFQDVKFGSPSSIQSYFNRLMNGENFIHPSNPNKITGSVREYWEEASYGQLSINSTVVGPYTSTFNRAFYGTNWIKDDPTSDAMTLRLVYEAASKAANDVDMSNFDNNNDGIVDFVHVVFAGCNGDENKKAIWPHKGYIPGILRDWVWISKYIVTPEIENNTYASIGTICHEMGHALGAPDFYDTDEFKSGGYFEGTGKWDLMASGNYNNKENYPAHPNPYIKTEIYGWATATELSGNNKEYTLRPSEIDKNSIYKLSTSTPGEYYLLENRQGLGLPGSGLVIYHVNSGIENVNRYKINVGHPQNLYVVAANKHIQKPTGNTYSYGNINSPATTFKDSVANNIFFTSQTLPSNCDWAENTTTNKDVCFIKEVANNGEKQITFVLNPEISGPDVLCDSAIYSLPHVPDSATIVWSYVRPAGTPPICTPLYIGTGQGTKNVCFRRGGEMRVENSGPGLEQPDFPWQPASVTSPPVFTYVKYVGFITIKATVTFNNTTYTVTKEIYMPEKVEIDDQGMGFGNPWKPGVTKTITLASPLNSEIVADILWEVDMVGGSSFTKQGGTSVVLTPTSSVTTISITATYLRGCDDEDKTCTKVFPVYDNLSMSFANPASGNVEINILAGGETDSNMRTINNPEPYMGAYRLELWHDLYGKVREIDVAENTPTVTMNLDGLNSGVYVLRLIIDNQIITAEQLIVK